MSPLKRFDLDYASRTRPARVLGALLLAGGALLLADTARQIVLAQRAVHSLETALALESRRPAGTTGTVGSESRAPARPVRLEDVRAAEAIARRLTLPWEALFGPLEATRLTGIRLSAITPDAERRTVTVTGEAKDYLQVLNLVAALSHDETLSRVRLVRHEPRGEDPRFAVAFELAARWGERP